MIDPAFIDPETLLQVTVAMFAAIIFCSVLAFSICDFLDWLGSGKTKEKKLNAANTSINSLDYRQQIDARSAQFW